MTARKLKFCETFLRSCNATETAKEMGINRATVYKWLKDTEVSEYISAVTATASEELMLSLQARAKQAVDTLATVMEGDNPPKDKVKASEVVIDNAIRLMELERVTNRIDELEQSE